MTQILANYTVVVHPSAIISTYTTIGEGTVIMPHVVVNAAVNIGNHGIINTGAVIESKQSSKGKYTSLSITVNLANPDKVIEKYKEVGLVEGVISL